MKELFEIIDELRPYFFSLREIQDKICLDLRLPISWKFEFETKPIEIEIKINDKNSKFNLITLISDSNFIGYQNIFNYGNFLIKTNKEEEEKNRLFQEKVEELKILFKHQSLETLKEINLIGHETRGYNFQERVGDGEESLGK